MRVTSKRSDSQKAFVLGFLGAAVTVFAFWIGVPFFLGTLSGHRPVAELLLMSFPFLAAFAWCGWLRVYLPARTGVAPAGYASVFALLGLLLGLLLSDLVVTLLLLTASVVAFIAGHLGQVLVIWRLQYPRGRPREPTCPYCGYGLYYARKHVCPECGQPFLGADVDMRLTKWEDGVLKPRDAKDGAVSGQSEERSS
jgi:predicted RNA-binding Zn-ribbon protein involved in translation (DUF1610 family)